MVEVYKPVAGLSITSPFGMRGGSMHNGIDYPANLGTPLYAVADGVVVEGRDRPQGSVDGFGSWIWIDHQDSIRRDSIYGHVTHPRILVKEGDVVKAGQLIGYSGNEGSDTTGPHLHFELWTAPGRNGGAPVDPAPLVRTAREPGGTPQPSPQQPEAKVATVLDTAGGYPSPASIKAAGHSGILLYVSPSRPQSNFPGKRLEPAILKMYSDANIPFAPVWQFGKPGSSVGSDYEGGYDRGFQDALNARGNWFRCGGPGWTPFYFAVDEDITLDTWNRVAVHYFRGVNAAIGKEWTGIYGSTRVCAWAAEDDVIGWSTTPGKRWAWQCRAWSGTEINGDAVLYQRVIDTASNPGPRVDGIVVDVNDVLAPDWGQTGINRKPGDAPAPPPPPPPPAVVIPKPEYNMQFFDRSGTCPHSPTYGAGRRLFALHTEEPGGPPRPGDAERLWRSSKDGRNFSYHWFGDNAVCIQGVGSNDAAWAVLDANPYTLNFVFAGSKASQSRQVWLEHFGNAIDFAAKVFVDQAKIYDPLDPFVRSPAEIGRGLSGATDHWGITTGLRIGDHTDVGPNFPWDKFIEAVAKYRDGVNIPPPPPPVNMIDKKLREIGGEAGWIGKRLFAGERDCRDGKGKYVNFEKGTIYFRDKIGAQAVPIGLMEVYAKYDYEMGPQGYPIGDHTVLKDQAGNVIGGVIGCEFGALYREVDAAEGFRVGGFIRDYWNRLGFENGLGWPVSEELDFVGGKYQLFRRRGEKAINRVYWPKRGAIAFTEAAGFDPVVPDKD